MLQGADGTLFKEHQENCAPCHNPNIDLRIDPTLTGVTAGHAVPGLQERRERREDAAVRQLCGGVPPTVPGACATGGTCGRVAVPQMPGAGGAESVRSCRDVLDSLWPRGPQPASGGDLVGSAQPGVDICLFSMYRLAVSIHDVAYRST